MFGKIIALFMSLVMSVTGFASDSITSVFDTLMTEIFGVPVTQEAVNADFFDGIDDSDVVEIDAGTGFLKDKLIVFLDDNLSYLEKISFFADCGGTLIGWCAPINLYVIQYSTATYGKMVEKCTQLSETHGVALAMPAFASKLETQMTPNDPFESDNDAEEEEGIITETELVWDETDPDGKNWWLEAIDARQAWDYSEYFSDIYVGVLDAGFNTSHPELADKIYFPTSKAARRNYPDDHGTHVSGIIAAEKNNGIGLAGVCDNADLICVDWEPNLLQIWSTDLAIFFGFSDVVKAGAKVVNLSLGISSSNFENDAGYIYGTLIPKATSLIMASLLDKGYDFLVVQSAGNGNYDGDPIDVVNNGNFCSITEENIYTGKYNVSKEEILGRIVRVASAGSYNGNNEYRISTFSNAGDLVDIAAPGEDIYSSAWTYDYGLMSGTSMSAPVVTGVASLVWSVNPEFTGVQVKDIICTSYDSRVRTPDDFEYYYDLGTPDYPMVNAKLSVEEALRRSRDDMGVVSGKTPDPSDKIIVGENEITVLPDGSFSFMLPAGGYPLIITSTNGTVIETSVTVIAGETTVLY